MKFLNIFVLTSLLVSTPILAEKAKKISLDFTDIPAQKLVKIISDFSQKGLILPSSKLGSTSIYIKNVPWDEALNGIAKSNNFQVEITENLIIITK